MFSSVIHGQEREDDEEKSWNVDEIHVKTADIPCQSELRLQTRERARGIRLIGRNKVMIAS